MAVNLELTDEIEKLWQAVTSGRVSYTTFAALQVAIARPLGSIAEVQGDNGTHEDPVSSQIVPNDGVYRRVPEGWQWIGPITSPLFIGIGDGVEDNSVAVQAEYDRLVAAGGGVLQFPAGIFRVTLNLTSRDVHVRGLGAGVTILRPATDDGVAIRNLTRIGGWNAVTIEGLTIEGAGTLQGIGYKAGADVYEDLDEYTGIVRFRNVAFNNLDKHIDRPFGSIGLYLDHCLLGSANFHLHGRGIPEDTYAAGGGNDLMHAGNIELRGCHRSGAVKASIFIDSPALDSGQVLVHGGVCELNPGYAWYVKNFSSGGGVPGIRVVGEWVESNATGGAISVDGEGAAAPKFASFNNCSAQVVFEDTPVASLGLVASSVLTRDCNLTNLVVTADADSSVEHERPRAFTGAVSGRTKDVGRPSALTGIATPWFEVGLPRGLSKAWNSKVLYRSDGSANINFTGTAGRASVDGAANDYALVGATKSQDFTVNNAETEFPSATYTIGADKYFVQLRIERIISGGPVVISQYPTGFGGALEIDWSDWRCMVNITHNPGAAMAGQQFSYINAPGATHVGISALAFLEFGTLQEALDFVNSGLFPA